MKQNSRVLPVCILACFVCGDGMRAQQSADLTTGSASQTTAAPIHADVVTSEAAPPSSSVPLSLPAGGASTSPLDPDSTTPLMAAVQRALYWGDVGERGGLTLSAVMSIASRSNPNLGTYAANRAAAQAELIRALEYPNPTIEMEFGRETARSSEGGNRSSRGTNEVALAQPIELPGKRLARRVEAESGFAINEAERVEFLATLRADVTEAYFTVQYHVALERLYDSLLGVAAALKENARVRMEVGEVSRLEVLNAHVEQLKAQREKNASTRRRLAAAAALNALTGGRLPERFKLADGFKSHTTRPSLQSAVESALACHPRLTRLAAELEQKYSTLDRERTEWWPDVRLGVRKSGDLDSESVAGTIGVEIPLWSRNQGAVARAHADAQKTYNDIFIALNEIRRDAVTAWNNLELAREQITSYDDGIKAASEQAVELAYKQYELGATGYSEVLIARRNLQESEHGYIQALYDGAVARARLDRAIGLGLAPDKQAARQPTAANRKGVQNNR